MTRETKRQIARLRRLASELLTNPDYDQNRPKNCIIGLGNRLVGGKVLDADPNGEFWDGHWDYISRFSEKFGVDYNTVKNIFYGKFSRVNRKARDWDVLTLSDNKDRNSPKMRRSAAAIVNFIANRKEQGLAV